MSNTIFNPQSLGALKPYVTNNPLNIISNRAPLVTDRAPIGQVWIYPTNNAVYQLTSITAGNSIWTDLTGGSGDFTNLVVTGTATIGSTLMVTGTTTLAGLNAGATTVTNFSATGTTVSIGATSAGATTTLQAGTGATGLDLSAAGNVQVVPGTVTVASPTSTATLNTRVGVVTFTGFTTAMAGTQNFLINNSKILATSAILAYAYNFNASGNDAAIAITATNIGAGTLSITVTNNGAGALGAGDNVLIAFWVLS